MVISSDESDAAAGESDAPAGRARARQLAAEAVESGEGPAWFERLYAEAAAGQAIVPWDDGEPNPNLTQWAPGAVARGIAGPGTRALVVGCGVSDDPVFLAGLGCQVTAFDISPSAIAEASKRFAGSGVEFTTADLLELPPAWDGAFDLVVEIYTIQPLFGPVRAAAIANLHRLVAPGGTLLLIARATQEDDPVRDPGMMPWALTRAELEAVAGGVLSMSSVEMFTDSEDPPKLRWRAEFTRP